MAGVGGIAFVAVLALLLLLATSAAASRSAYVTSTGGDTISTFTVDRASGSLSPAAPAGTSAGSSPGAVALRPDGAFLYVASSGSDEVLGYSVGADGSLSSFPAAFAAGTSPSGLTATADGRFLYAVNQASNDISGWTIEPAGGLTSLPGSPFAGINGNAAIASSPSSKLLYVTKPGPAPNVRGYSVAASGALTQLPAAAADAGSGAGAIAVTPDGGRLYVADGPNDRIHGFAVAPSGALAGLAGSPFSAVSPTGSLAISPAGDRLYAPSAGGVISGFAIAPTGSLAPLPGSPYPGPAVSSAAALTPDGLHLYADSPGAQPNVFGYATGSDGSLSAVNGSPFSAAGTAPAPGSIAVSPDQPPVAAFSAYPASPGVGERTTFVGSASTDSDGGVASYTWDFGDGKQRTESDSKARHRYGRPGTYRATLTTTDGEGCSTDRIYTGQTTLCNGSAVAVTTRQVVVVDREILNPEVSVGFYQKQRGNEVRITAKVSAKERTTVTIGGTLKVQGEKKRIALGRVTKKLRSGKAKRFTLKLKRRSYDRKVLRALDRGGSVRAKLRVKFVDKVGNRYVIHPPVALR